MPDNKPDDQSDDSCGSCAVGFGVGILAAALTFWGGCSLITHYYRPRSDMDMGMLFVFVGVVVVSLFVGVATAVGVTLIALRKGGF